MHSCVNCVGVANNVLLPFISDNSDFKTNEGVSLYFGMYIGIYVSLVT